MKKALITGISGQDGSYLAEYLVEQGYQVFGFVRREPQTMRSLASVRDQIEFLYGDLRDATSIATAVQKAWPDELYNLAAQAFVPTSWEHPAATFDINVGGLARILQTVERVKPDARVYQASSSEMYGNIDGFCDERTPFRPTSPYGVSKMSAHHLVQVYRQRGIYAVGGILFNHESPRRGVEMVTRKITRAAVAWARGDKTKVRLGNLEARRDWGFAGDYVKAMHAMLQLPEPKDYVIATGISHSVREFVAGVLEEVHHLTGKINGPLEDYVEVDPRLLRTGEIHDLRGECATARRELGWKPATDFKNLVAMMVRSDLASAGVPFSASQSG